MSGTSDAHVKSWECEIAILLVAFFGRCSPGASGRPFGFTTPNGDIESHWEAQEVMNYSYAGDLSQF